MARTNTANGHIRRRAFLHQGSLFLAGSVIGGQYLLASDAKPRLRIGMVTDLHYADREPVGNRHYHFVILDACFRSDGTPYGRKNNAYAVMDMLPADTIRVRGVRKQQGYDWR